MASSHTAAAVAGAASARSTVAWVEASQAARSMPGSAAHAGNPQAASTPAASHGRQARRTAAQKRKDGSKVMARQAPGQDKPGKRLGTKIIA
ncbi:hypothetical protein AQPW35_45120 [Rubrivivax pictus]|uniref:Uncharacterized protein n=1 Tax=Pseudaquabacterium pictum TaxID=2315236 RepID=A0A480AVK7_9BURK|nr:hypothetical protein AQPW35_45120 [Rubrivivax pictus]